MEILFQKILLFKSIRHTRHFKNMMRWRKISQNEIEQTLHSPDEIVRRNGKRYFCLKKIKTKQIKIIFTVEDNQIIIITAFDKSG